MPKQTKQVTLIDLDFENLKALTDRALYQRFRFVCSLNKKRVIPRNLKANGFRVTREPKRITLHFIWSDSTDDAGTEVFQFSFMPAPRFA